MNTRGCPHLLHQPSHCRPLCPPQQTPYRGSELWAHPPLPHASPPVLCSHKALHYHRAWRDREALKSGVQLRREGGVVVAKRGSGGGEGWVGGCVCGGGGCRFIVAHRSMAVGLVLRESGCIRSQLSPFSGRTGTNTTVRSSSSSAGDVCVFIFIHGCCFFNFLLFVKKLSPGGCSHRGAGCWTELLVQRCSKSFLLPRLSLNPDAPPPR